MSPRPLRIAVFCGGRGSSSILRELIRRRNVDLNLLINAYDDGLSTGALRTLIPGMLGPSDFRKNLSYLLELHSRQQFDLVKILEYRLPPDFSHAEFDGLIAALQDRRPASAPEVATLFGTLDAALAGKLSGYLQSFRTYVARQGTPFTFADCALGNLLFVGAYLENGRSFNAAVHDLTRAMGCNAKLINVTRGENRVLVGLKADGELLFREANIVGPQSASRIAGIYLLAAPLSEQQRRALEGLPFDEKRRRLEALEAPVGLSFEAEEAIVGADILVYGPGTQFSSLLPSYKTLGLAQAIDRSAATIKALVVNLRHDHDIQGLGAMDIVDETLRYLGDPSNQGRKVTHVLASRCLQGSGPCPAGPAPQGNVHRGAVWLEQVFENVARKGVHNGHVTVKTLLSLLRGPKADSRETLDIYVDLREREAAAPLVVNEFTELEWSRRFARTRLMLNGVPELAMRVAAPLELATTRRTEMFSEVEVLREWLRDGDADYLVTLAGDGEYRLADILVAVDVLRSGEFGAVFGSRNQSRRQMLGSLAYAYPETRTLYWGSFLGAYVFSGLFALRFRFMLSDPFTGFRVYRRSAFAQSAGGEPQPLDSGSDVAKLLLTEGIEIAEIPVHYRTFKGFTNVKTRFARGLKNAATIFTR